MELITEDRQKALGGMRYKLRGMYEKIKKPVKKDKAGNETVELDGQEYDVKTVVNEIRTWNENQEKEFASEKAIAKRNIDVCFDEHWDDESLEKFKLNDRIALSIHGIFPKIMSLLGFEKSNRQQFEAEPDEQGDELTAQIYNILFRHIEKNNSPKKYEYTKSDIFMDGVIPFFGCSEIYTETNDAGNMEVKIRQLPYYEVLFDRNFSDFEATGCSRYQHYYQTYIDELKLMHGNLKDKFDGIEENTSNTDQQAVTETTNTYDKLSDMNKGKKQVRVIRDWKKIITDVYELHLIEEDKVYPFNTKEEAEEKKLELLEAKKQAVGSTIQELTTNGINIDETGRINNQMYYELASAELDDNFIIKPVPKEMWQYTKIAGGILIEGPEILEVDETPITLYFSIFIAGKIIPLVSIARGLQLYIDRLFAQVDLDIGTDTKNTKVVYADRIHEEFQTVEEAITAVAEGKVVIARGGTGEGPPFAIAPRAGTSNQYFQIFEILLKLLEDIFGGRNFAGAEESAGQSGKAIQRLQAAAAIMTLNYMDNLRRYDEQVGRKMVKFIKKFYTHKFTLKVIGDDMSKKIQDAFNANGQYRESALYDGIGWLVVNDPGNEKVKPLSEANLSISINKVSARQDEMDVEYEKLMGLKSQGYIVPVKAVLDTMQVKATLKTEIIAANEQADAMNAKLQAMNMDITKMKESMSIANQAKGMMGNGQEKEKA